MKNADVFNDNIHIMGKGNKERFVAKSPHMAKVLLRYYTLHQGFFEFKQIPDPLFLSCTGKPLTVVAVERVVRMAGETAKVRKNICCSPHTCRHYFAQCQLQNGSDVYSVSRLLGSSCNGSFSNQ
ncbi:tyrosine-type recombinase/integrase [Butyricicoccus sp. Marseille-Q5471]|uniref:tyrosine-type recombinase/integrase n=1 Tax=Butyricicoccus sp. Marseille-Q5471 TaxID=3039493 RepID=UPI0024BC7BCB|nr:tyrosine-type recombinase/integrase [Butyricicoccus sp. Marseille-Q5471]